MLLMAYSLVAVNNYCIKISFNADMKINPLLFEVRIPVWTEKDRLRKDKEYSINLFLFLNQINQQDHYRNPGINIALLLLFWFWLLANRRIQHTGALSISLSLRFFLKASLSLSLAAHSPKKCRPKADVFSSVKIFRHSFSSVEAKNETPWVILDQFFTPKTAQLSFKENSL